MKKNLEDCPSWWWKTKISSGKVRGPICIRLTKLTTQFWLIKGPSSENIFSWGKKNTNLDR